MVIRKVRNNARHHAELVELWGLHHEFGVGAAEAAGVALIGQRAPPLKCDSGCQTATHPMESNIVPGYESSEWELRRRAIKLANLRTKKTHSTQTDKSNYRRSAEAQVYLPKTSSTQTMRDASTSVPKPVTYHRGLRGPRGSGEPAEVVDLTLEIGGVALDVDRLRGTKASR